MVLGAPEGTHQLLKAPRQEAAGLLVNPGQSAVEMVLQS
jgi:hypothetical protein